MNEIDKDATLAIAIQYVLPIAIHYPDTNPDALLEAFQAGVAFAFDEAKRIENELLENTI